MAPLVVVESLGRQRILLDLLRRSGRPDWSVFSCDGHYCGLPHKSIGIDYKTGKFSWSILDKKTYSALKRLVESSDVVYAATDLSPEGESLANQLSISAHLLQKQCTRLRIRSLDVKGLEFSLGEETTAVDASLLNSYLIREGVDRLIRFSVCPEIQKSLGTSSTNIHRVAFPLLSELARTERRIRSYVPRTVNIVRAILSDGTTAESQEVRLEDIDSLVSSSSKLSPVFTSSEEEVAPLPPFTLSSLLQFCGKRYALSALTVLRACDALFSLGLITYPYTDTHSISCSQASRVRSWIEDRFGSDFLSANPLYVDDSLTAHAICPVSIESLPTQLELSPDFRNVYSAIWFRVLGSQGKNAKISHQILRFPLSSSLSLVSSGLVIIKANWYQLSGRLFEPVVRPIGPDLHVEAVKAWSFTSSAPDRHTHGSLVSWLDRKSIGGLWTYGPALTSLEASGCVQTSSDGLHLTPKGETVVTLIKRTAPDLIDPEACAALEQEFRSVETGSKSMGAMLFERNQWATELAKNISSNGLSPSFTSPTGEQAQIALDSNALPYAYSGSWKSSITFDAKGKMIQADPAVSS